MTRVRDLHQPRPEPCCRCIMEWTCEQEAPPGPKGPRFYCPFFIDEKTGVPGYPLPNLDREKVKAFVERNRAGLIKRRKEVGKRKDEWGRGRLELVQDMIGEILSEAWDVK
jgi:hypothetical protein